MSIFFSLLLLERNLVMYKILYMYVTLRHAAACMWKRIYIIALTRAITSNELMCALEKKNNKMDINGYVLGHFELYLSLLAAIVSLET